MFVPCILHLRTEDFINNNYFRFILEAAVSELLLFVSKGSLLDGAFGACGSFHNNLFAKASAKCKGKRNSSL